jgi:DNA-binding response OmpR family regulator
MPIKILVADDDQLMRDLVCDILHQQGYMTIQACDGYQAIDSFFSEPSIELIILDVMMPKCDGFTVLETIRKESNVPILLLTALGDEQNEVEGLQRGADDYIAKPFGYAKFIARVELLLKKINGILSEGVVVGDIRIDFTNSKVAIQDKKVDLSRKEYQLLLYLVRNKNQLMTREQLLNQIWGFDFEGDPRTLDTHIKTLRAKIGDNGAIIKTVRGIGFRFEGDQL